jgi:hypothetical protein
MILKVARKSKRVTRVSLSKLRGSIGEEDDEELDLEGKKDDSVKALSICRLMKEGCVYVNGDLIQVGEKVELLHHDKVTFGRAHIFRTYLTSTEGISDDQQMVR